MADPKANAELARDVYNRWNARDFDRLAELMAKDKEIVLVGSDTRFRGPAGAIEILTDVGGWLSRRTRGG